MDKWLIRTLQFEYYKNPPLIHNSTNNKARYDMNPNDLMTMEYVSIVSEEL